MMVPTLYDSPGFPFNASIEDVFHQNTVFHSIEGLFQVIGTTQSCRFYRPGCMMDSMLAKMASVQDVFL